MTATDFEYIMLEEIRPLIEKDTHLRKAFLPPEK